jgi:uncharacterized protein (UPF0332 family)
MSNERQLHMQKAVRLLQSVNKRAASDEPEAVASTAYYAMHHAACAVLLHRGKTLPKTHSSLIGLFGLVVRDLGPESREAGAALHNAFETRSTGDYSAAVRLSRADAIAARDAAQSFVAYCRILQRKFPPRGKKD